MGRTLEQYTAEAEGAYKPAVDAVQAQINALPGQLTETNEQINKQYAQQRARLNNARNDAAYNASMQAAGSGGSFGGSANIANRKYYSQSFVPAITQMNTNLSNDLSSARMNSENQRLSLASQLANMQANSKQQALQAYYAAEEAEKNRAAQQAMQREQLAAQNASNQYLMSAMDEFRKANQANNQVKSWDFGNGYSISQGPNGQAIYAGPNGNAITAGQFLEATRGTGNKWDLWKDVWNNGISTDGVGSDTIAFYDSINPNNASFNQLKSASGRYGYLYY